MLERLNITFTATGTVRLKNERNLFHLSSFLFPVIYRYWTALQKEVRIKPWPKERESSFEFKRVESLESR